MAKKKTSNCKACGNLVSKTAKFCIHCGEKNKHKNETGNIVFLGILLFCGFALMGSFDSTNSPANNSSNKPEAQEQKAPSSPCVTNFRECTSQEELVNNYRDGLIEAGVSCKVTADDMARYGSVDVPFFYAFGSY